MATSDKLAFSVREAAESLGVSRAFIYEVVRTGELPSVRIGTRILIPKAGIDALLKTTPSTYTSGSANKPERCAAFKRDGSPCQARPVAGKFLHGIRGS